MTPRRLLLAPHAAIDLEIAELHRPRQPGPGRKLRRRVGSEMPGGRRDAELYPARTDLAPGLRMAVHGRYVVLYRDLPGENARARGAVVHSSATCRGWSDRRNRRGLVLGTRPLNQKGSGLRYSQPGKLHSPLSTSPEPEGVSATPFVLPASTMMAIRRPDRFCWCRNSSVCRHQEIEARLLRGGQQGAIAQPIPSSRPGPCGESARARPARSMVKQDGRRLARIPQILCDEFQYRRNLLFRVTSNSYITLSMSTGRSRVLRSRPKPPPAAFPCWPCAL